VSNRMTQIVNVKAAQKKHRCSWCGEAIEIGDTYSRYRYFMDGDAGSVRMHPECLNAMQTEGQETGEWVEWSPYSNTRGLADSHL